MGKNGANNVWSVLYRFCHVLEMGHLLGATVVLHTAAVSVLTQTPFGQDEAMVCVLHNKLTSPPIYCYSTSVHADASPSTYRDIWYLVIITCMYQVWPQAIHDGDSTLQNAEGGDLADKIAERATHARAENIMHLCKTAHQTVGARV